MPVLTRARPVIRQVPNGVILFIENTSASCWLLSLQSSRYKNIRDSHLRDVLLIQRLSSVYFLNQFSTCMRHFNVFRQTALALAFLKPSHRLKGRAQVWRSPPLSYRTSYPRRHCDSSHGGCGLRSTLDSGHRGHQMGHARDRVYSGDVEDNQGNTT